MKTKTLLLVLATMMGGLSCTSKDAVLTPGSGGAAGNLGSGGVSGSGGTSASGGHAGATPGGRGGAPGSGGTASGGQGAGGSAGTGTGGLGSGGQAGGQGGSLGSGGVGGRSPTDGGVDGFNCETAQCARPYECIRACGGPIEYTGCCPCVAPLFDNFNNFGCKGTGGAGGGAGGASCAQIKADYTAALQTAKVCNEAISSRQPCATAVKIALGCLCTTFVDDASVLKPYEDAWSMAGCSLACDIGCITVEQKGVCDSPSTTTTQGVCHDVPL